MTLIDRLEKIGRLVLWFALASAAVLAPITYIRQRAAESAAAEAARKEDQENAKKAKEQAEKSDRLTLASMGQSIRALAESKAAGYVWFTNATPRSGVVCVAGTATNPNTKASTTSLPSCKAVGPYATNVEVQLMFAGGNIADVCKGGPCELTVAEAPDGPAAPAAKQP